MGGLEKTEMPKTEMTETKTKMPETEMTETKT